jgi:hypothetical protein
MRSLIELVSGSAHVRVVTLEVLRGERTAAAAPCPKLASHPLASSLPVSSSSLHVPLGRPTVTSSTARNSQGPGKHLGTKSVDRLVPARPAGRQCFVPPAVRWAPDGRAIAFVREFESKVELYILDSLGASPR